MTLTYICSWGHPSWIWLQQDFGCRTIHWEAALRRVQTLARLPHHLLTDSRHSAIVQPTMQFSLNINVVTMVNPKVILRNWYPINVIITVFIPVILVVMVNEAETKNVQALVKENGKFTYGYLIINDTTTLKVFFPTEMAEVCRVQVQENRFINNRPFLYNISKPHDEVCFTVNHVTTQTVGRYTFDPIKSPNDKVILHIYGFRDRSEVVWPDPGEESIGHISCDFELLEGAQVMEIQILNGKNQKLLMSSGMQKLSRNDLKMHLTNPQPLYCKLRLESGPSAMRCHAVHSTGEDLKAGSWVMILLLINLLNM